jgi:hypothetical protein
MATPFHTPVLGWSMKDDNHKPSSEPLTIKLSRLNCFSRNKSLDRCPMSPSVSFQLSPSPLTALSTRSNPLPHQPHLLLPLPHPPSFSSLPSDISRGVHGLLKASLRPAMHYQHTPCGYPLFFGHATCGRLTNALDSSFHTGLPSSPHPSSNSPIP